MIHHTVTDTYLTDPAQFLKYMEQVHFPKLPDDFEICNANLKYFLTQVSKYQTRFVARWQFMEQKSDPKYHLKLQGTPKKPGMIECFLKNIPFEVGECIHRKISTDRIKACKGSFRAYLMEFTREMEEIIEDTHRSSRLSELYQRNRVTGRIERQKATGTDVQELKHVSSAPDESEDEDEDVTFQVSFDSSTSQVSLDALKAVSNESMEQVRGFTIKSKVNKGEVHESTASGSKDKKRDAKPPGGCLTLLNTGECTKQGCKYFHEPESRMRETWDYYMVKLLSSRFRRPKEKLLELYPEGKVSRILARPAVNQGSADTDEVDGVDDPLYEDANMAHMVLMASFPEAEYVTSIHREGSIVVEDDGAIPVRKALFDSGALHGSYISKELVDEHRCKLSPFIQKVHGTVKLGDNITTINVDEVLVTVVDFQLDSGEHIRRRIKLVVWPMPGLDMIIGLPHIVRHYMHLFLEMLKDVRNKLAPGALNVLMNPWTTDTESAAPEDEETPLPCFFSGPLHYLSTTRDQALTEYVEMFDKHIDAEFAKATDIKEYLLTEEAKSVFVPAMGRDQRDTSIGAGL